MNIEIKKSCYTCLALDIEIECGDRILFECCITEKEIKDVYREKCKKYELKPMLTRTQ